MVYHHKATTTTGGGGPSFICICKCKNLKSTAWLQYYCELVTFLLAMLHTAWRPMTIRVGSLGMLNGMYSMYMSSCLDFCAFCLFELVTSVFENSCTAMHVNFQHDLTCQVLSTHNPRILRVIFPNYCQTCRCGSWWPVWTATIVSTLRREMIGQECFVPLFHCNYVGLGWRERHAVWLLSVLQSHVRLKHRGPRALSRPAASWISSREMTFVVSKLNDRSTHWSDSTNDYVQQQSTRSHLAILEMTSSSSDHPGLPVVLGHNP